MEEINNSPVIDSMTSNIKHSSPTALDFDFIRYTSTRGKYKITKYYLKTCEISKKCSVEEKVLSQSDLFENVLNDLKKVKDKIY